MARTLNRLTARTVETAAAGKHSDGGGLYLIVAQDGRRKWSFIYTSPAGRRREMGLGVAGKGGVALVDARQLAAAARDHLAHGFDPIDKRDAAREAQAEAEQERKRVKAATFALWAERYIATHEHAWRNAKHRYQWRATLLKDAAALGDKPVAQVTRADVLAVLEPIWRKKPETATRLRGRIERVMDAAIAAGDRIDPNPAIWKGGLEPLLGAMPKAARVIHQRALSWKDVPAFVHALRARQGDSVAALAAEWLVLTAARTGEVIGATWGEIEMQAEGGPVWRVPASRMKAGREHVVPLVPQAITLLERAKPLTGGAADAPIFPAPRLKGGKPVGLSNMAMLVLLDRMGWRDRTTMHGLRSAFRDWCAEQTSFPREIAEAALAHVNADKVEAAYLRTGHLTKRRKLMQTWAGWIDKGVTRLDRGDADGSANVVPIAPLSRVTG